MCVKNQFSGIKNTPSKQQTMNISQKINLISLSSDAFSNTNMNVKTAFRYLL